jgi:hypothetical protein
MRWIPWIVLGVLAAGIGLIFTKGSHRATKTTSTASSTVNSRPLANNATGVAPAAFSAPAETGSARRAKPGRETALAAYNQEASPPEDTAPPTVEPAAVPDDAPIGQDAAVPQPAPAQASQTELGSPNPLGTQAAAPSGSDALVPVNPPTADNAADASNPVNPLPEPRTNGVNGDNRPLSNLDPPVGARDPILGTHDSAHQPYYPSAKSAAAGPLPRRNVEAWEAIHRKAAAKAEMRGRRLATQKWFGYSNLRPTASATPFVSTYSPAWTSNSAHPSQWHGVR